MLCDPNYHWRKAMDLGLKGKVAIVAAASSGLGKATAMELAAEGAKVTINARNSEQLQRAAAEIKSATNAEVLAIPGDVTNEEDIRGLIAETKERFGSVDILVTNAGGPPSGSYTDFTAADYRKAVELNLISTITLCQEAIPLMKEKGWGRIVGVTSISAKQPVEYLILSNTARAGALGYLKTLSQQIGAFGITVNAVCPGFHVTERLRQLAASSADKEGISVEAVLSRNAASLPLKRLGQPEEFAALVAFLCSERAGYVTGTAIQIDGGQYKGLF